MHENVLWGASPTSSHGTQPATIPLPASNDDRAQEPNCFEVNRYRIAVFPHSTELSVFVEINGMAFLPIENFGTAMEH
jgi:hypothetical protein